MTEDKKPLPKQRNGYDRYLDYQYGSLGSFFTCLFKAIQIADPENTKKLQLGFPEEVNAYKIWKTIGWETFLARCTPGNPQIARMRAEHE